MMAVNVTTLADRDIAAALPALARLRIEVFRAFPYLYDGTLAYEEAYLSQLQKAKHSIIVKAEDGSEVVGCATGSALSAHHSEFAEPFAKAGLTLDDFFYCGESVLLPACRGQGIGHAFFDHRESFARSKGYKYSTFCGVVRPKDHPLRPADYSPLDPFWMKRGYKKAEGLTTEFSWKDIDQPAETPHLMQFWIKDL